MYESVNSGGLPGGSAVATLLSITGRDLVFFERGVFPGVCIGESLLPRNMRSEFDLFLWAAAARGGIGREGTRIPAVRQESDLTRRITIELEKAKQIGKAEDAR